MDGNARLLAGAPVKNPSLLFIDTGRAGGQVHMGIDRRALLAAADSSLTKTYVRFFQWSEPTITYGHLLDVARVKSWAKEFPPAPLVQRPTGGGAVYHTPSELSFSLLWARHAGPWPSTPKDAYREIHRIALEAVAEVIAGPELCLRPANSCAQRPSETMSQTKFSACFQEPVCNDVMWREKKIVGGALRLTKKAVLYQGAIQLETIDAEQLKTALKRRFAAFLDASPVL
jgi:lipoate-protein ligase A